METTLLTFQSLWGDTFLRSGLVMVRLHHLYEEKEEGELSLEEEDSISLAEKSQVYGLDLIQSNDFMLW